jgi:aspartyl-tRNA(Asn)/glutamyl-tRNA(Gln) amidotransferase subunit A
MNRAARRPLPSGTAANGIPTGVQIVARTYDDETVFRLGAVLERELALWTTHDWWPTL